MSVNEIQALAQRFADAFDKRDMKTAVEMLSDDVEVFDHVPYRFDGKQLFAKYLSEAFESIASTSFGFRQPSCRVYNDTVGIVNAYDMFMGVTKDGKALTDDGCSSIATKPRGSSRQKHRLARTHARTAILPTLKKLIWYAEIQCQLCAGGESVQRCGATIFFATTIYWTPAERNIGCPRSASR